MFAITETDSISSATKPDTIPTSFRVDEGDHIFNIPTTVQGSDTALGSNIITGVVQDWEYEEAYIVEQNIVPFRFDNYLKSKDENVE